MHVSVVGSNSNRVTIVTAFVCALVLSLIGLFVYKRGFESSCYKVTTPGSYHLNLKEGDYCVWLFDVWSGKCSKKPNVSLSPRSVAFRLTMAGREVPIRNRDSSLSFEYSADGRHGQLFWDVRIPKTGVHELTVTTNSQTSPHVLVIAPASEHSYDLGSNMIFDGILNDNFVSSN